MEQKCLERLQKVLYKFEQVYQPLQQSQLESETLSQVQLNSGLDKFIMDFAKSPTHSRTTSFGDLAGKWSKADQHQISAMPVLATTLNSIYTDMQKQVSPKNLFRLLELAHRVSLTLPSHEAISEFQLLVLLNMAHLAVSRFEVYCAKQILQQILERLQQVVHPEDHQLELKAVVYNDLAALALSQKKYIKCFNHSTAALDCLQTCTSTPKTKANSLNKTNTTLITFFHMGVCLDKIKLEEFEVDSTLFQQIQNAKNANRFQSFYQKGYLLSRDVFGENFPFTQKFHKKMKEMEERNKYARMDVGSELSKFTQTLKVRRMDKVKLSKEGVTNNSKLIRTKIEGFSKLKRATRQTKEPATPVQLVKPQQNIAQSTIVRKRSILREKSKDKFLRTQKDEPSQKENTVSINIANRCQSVVTYDRQDSLSIISNKPKTPKNQAKNGQPQIKFLNLNVGSRDYIKEQAEFTRSHNKSPSIFQNANLSPFHKSSEILGQSTPIPTQAFVASGSTSFCGQFSGDVSPKAERPQRLEKTQNHLDAKSSLKQIEVPTKTTLPFCSRNTLTLPTSEKHHNNFSRHHNSLTSNNTLNDRQNRRTISKSPSFAPTQSVYLDKSQTRTIKFAKSIEGQIIDFEVQLNNFELHINGSVRSDQTAKLCGIPPISNHLINKIIDKIKDKQDVFSVYREGIAPETDMQDIVIRILFHYVGVKNINSFKDNQVQIWPKAPGLLPTIECAPSPVSCQNQTLQDPEQRQVFAAKDFEFMWNMHYLQNNQFCFIYREQSTPKDKSNFLRIQTVLASNIIEKELMLLDKPPQLENVSLFGSAILTNPPLPPITLRNYTIQADQNTLVVPLNALLTEYFDIYYEKQLQDIFDTDKYKWLYEVDDSRAWLKRARLIPSTNQIQVAVLAYEKKKADQPIHHGTFCVPFVPQTVSNPILQQSPQAYTSSASVLEFLKTCTIPFEDYQFLERYVSPREYRLTQTELSCIAFKRQYADNYPQALTISLWGINQIPRHFEIQTYSYENLYKKVLYVDSFNFEQGYYSILADLALDRKAKVKALAQYVKKYGEEQINKLFDKITNTYKKSSSKEPKYTGLETALSKVAYYHEF